MDHQRIGVMVHHPLAEGDRIIGDTNEWRQRPSGAWYHVMDIGSIDFFTPAENATEMARLLRGAAEKLMAGPESRVLPLVRVGQE